MTDKEMFDNWMKKKEEIQSRIERTDKMVKDREEEITLLENQISYLEETIDSFMDEPDIVIKKLQARNAELEKKLGIAVEGLEYYGSTDNWQETPNRNNLYQMIGNDVSDDFDDALRFGGKRAREALKAIKEI